MQSARTPVAVMLAYFARINPDRTRQSLWYSCSINIHDDVIKWKHFPRNWPLWIHRSPVTGEFTSQRPVTRSFDVFFDLHLNKRLGIQSRRRWFETLSRSLWRHSTEMMTTTETEMSFWRNFRYWLQLKLTASDINFVKWRHIRFSEWSIKVPIITDHRL